MKKILYFVAAMLIICTSCSDIDEKEQYIKIGDNTFIDLQTGDTVLIYYVDSLPTDYEYVDSI